MNATIALPEKSNLNEKNANLIARIVTGIIATAILLLVIFWKIVTPIPAIPPPTDMPTVEIGFLDGSGGDAATQGGGSFGNTGTPGMQNPSDAANTNPKTPTDNGSVTDPNSNNANASNSNHTSTTPQTNPSDDLAAALANWKKNKSAATINIGGDGKGDPYTGGMGNGSGSDHGPGQGDPGTGGPGGNNGNSTTGDGHRVRHILFSPEIVNPTQEEGKVVVNVYVDRKGVVKKVEGGSGSTTMNSTLVGVAKQSAFQIKFDEDATGPELLILPIDINFTLK
jgi:hypothetical protein